MNRASLALAACLLLAADVAAEPLVFSATGCGPYLPKEEPLLEKYLDLVARDGRSSFLLHLGDIVGSTRTKATEDDFIKVAKLLRGARLPVFIVPGDNEWNDQADPDRAWTYWVKHFSEFEKHFARAPRVERQKQRPENLAWVERGVLMIGINLVGGKVHNAKEWAARMDDNAAWVRKQIDDYGGKVRAAVVFAQARPVKDHEPFVKQLVEAAEKWKKPILYLHADGHVWEVQSPWRAANLVRVQTDQVGRNPPVEVTVTDDPREPFVFDRRLPDGKGKVAIRLK